MANPKLELEGVVASTPTGRGTNRLTPGAIKRFLSGKSATKKVFDGGGLFLTRTPAGTPVWRVKYRFGGKERTYAIGEYPAVGLIEARAARDNNVRALLREALDPQQARRLSRAEGLSASEATFAVVAAEFLAKEKRGWSPRHYQQTKRDLERDIYPLLGNLPIHRIKPAMIAEALKKVVARGAEETASKILWNVERIFRLAQAQGFRSDNPATPVREILPKQKPDVPRPALLKIEDLREVLTKGDRADLSASVRLCHRLVAFTAARIGNAITAEWQEFDLNGDTPCWTIPRAKMKIRQGSNDHRVLLGPTIANDLRTWRSVSRGRGWAFPSPTGKGHITHESLEKSYRVTLELRGKHSVHGWRASFSTLARDAGFSRDVVELTLDHLHDTPTVRSYDRGERLEERRRLMHWWDAQLTGRNDSTVIPLRPKATA